MNSASNPGPLVSQILPGSSISGFSTANMRGIQPLLYQPPSESARDRRTVQAAGLEQVLEFVLEGSGDLE